MRCPNNCASRAHTQTEKHPQSIARNVPPILHITTSRRMESSVYPGIEASPDQPLKGPEVLPEQDRTANTANAPGLDDRSRWGTSNQIVPLYTGSANVSDTLEVIQELHNTFAATGDTDFLDNAIGVAEELLNSDKHIIPVLNYLLGIRDNPTARVDRVEQDNTKTDGPSTDIGGNDVPPDEASSDLPRNHDLANVPSNDDAIQQIYKKYKATGEIVYLELSKGLELMHSSINLYTRYEQLRELEDLMQAIKVAEEALAKIPPGNNTPRAMVLANLGKMHLSRYERCGAVEDLEQAVKCTQEAVAGIPPDQPDRAMVVWNLGAMFGSRYRQFGAVEDLNQAIKWAEEAVTTSPPNGTDLPVRLSNLGLLLLERSRRSGSVEDLERAIKLLEQAVTEALPNHPNRLDMLTNLGLMLQSRFEQRGVLEDLDKAINWAEKAVEATPSGHLNYGIRLGNLGRMIICRYMRFGAAEDLEEAIKRTEEAVTVMTLLSPDSPYRATYLCNLGQMVHLRYGRFGVVQDLEQALKWTEEGVTAGSPDNPERADWLTNLGCLFNTRYQRFGALEDLEQAIKMTEAAVAAAPPNHQNQATRLTNLGMMLREKYHRCGALEDLEQAIKCTEKAVAAMPPNHPGRAMKLNNLALVLSNKPEAVEDLRRAIKSAEEVVTLIPTGDPNRQVALRLLGRLFHLGYQRLGELHYLAPAIKRLEEATAAQSPDHPERAWTLFSLSDTLSSRYKRSGSSQDFYYILRVLYEAWHCHMSPPQFRITAAGMAAIHLARKKMWQESSSLLGDAVKMISKVSLGSLGRDDQEYRVSKSVYPPLIPLAVSVSLQASEEASHCLRLLEHGRGLIMGLVIDCRNEISELRLKHPQESNKFDQLRIEIDSPLAAIDTSLQGGESTYQEARRRREKVVDELDEIVASIRELRGFEGFHLPPRSEDLISMAAEGPIVIPNSTEFRSDAIIVTRTAIKSLALPELSYILVEQHMSQIAQVTRGGRSTYAERNKEMEKILEWLWDAIVEPVFKELKLEAVVDGSDLPRIWWIGVGPLSMAPFHAAGYHSPGSTRNTLSRAISSYTPTIKALTYARQKKLELLNKPNPRILTVTMPTTPGKDWTPLRNAMGEVEKIVDLVKEKACATSLERPSTSHVLAKLPLHDAIHFACHGVSDAKSPSNSSLLLCKDDGTLDRLTVEAISRINIEHAQIAYLSACSTAENSLNDLVNESIYIASGFQLAGFSHVLAAQWVSNDKACRQVAGDFYKLLFDGKPVGGEGGHRKVSASFHHAVNKLRQGNWKQPIKWASFIHTGA